MRGQANSPAVASSASQTSNSSLTSLCVSLAARDPRLGNNTTSPSAASTFRASRSGVRDMPNDAHSSRSGILAPGAISPSVKMCRRREITSSCNMTPSLRSQFQCFLNANYALIAASYRILVAKASFCIQIGEVIALSQAGASTMNDTATLDAELLYDVRDGIGRVTFNR